jgi:hypothetical protein
LNQTSKRISESRGVCKKTVRSQQVRAKLKKIVVLESTWDVVKHKNLNVLCTEFPTNIYTENCGRLVTFEINRGATEEMKREGEEIRAHQGA